MSRVIPLTVVLYRVLMVCHVEFCYNHGEKVIRDKLFRWGTLGLETKPIRRFGLVRIVSYSCPSLMIIASASQFHVYLQ